MAPQKDRKKRKNKLDDIEPEYLGPAETHDNDETPADAEHEDTRAPDIEVSEEQTRQETDGVDKEQPAEKDSQTLVQPLPKRRRGPTKMKDIARDPNSRIRVEFNEYGEPCGEGSMKLSSYLGPLVHEHVPILINDWRRIG